MSLWGTIQRENYVIIVWKQSAKLAGVSLVNVDRLLCFSIFNYLSGKYNSPPFVHLQLFNCCFSIALIIQPPLQIFNYH